MRAIHCIPAPAVEQARAHPVLIAAGASVLLFSLLGAAALLSLA